MDPAGAWDSASPWVSLWTNRFYVYVGLACGISLWICFQIVIRRRDKSSQEKSVPKASRDLGTEGSISLQRKEVSVSGVKIFYGSQTGTAKGFAASLAEAVTSLDLPVAVVDLKDYDPDDHLVEEVTSKNVCAFMVATYTDGRPTESAVWFCKWLEEAASDFRFGKTYLKGMRYAVFGLGNSAYASHFNKVGKNVDKWLWMLGAHRVVARGEGDCDVANSTHGSIEADFRAWKTKFLARLQTLEKGGKKPCDGSCKRGQCESSAEEEPFESTSEDESGAEDRPNLNPVVDVEDLGRIVSCVKREKSMLRGRGGCYKHTFYGIESHRCMETTPSLACANKCVFCWRHHTNPVGTEWRWKMDQPEMILKEAIENHQSMIKQFKGVPGVKEERFEEGMMVKHCALSLVGEPIMYPEINRFLTLLHECKISSFLVTNAQFPVEIRNLKPVTQLYVSVDASTEDRLKKIDRPLFKDFWQRFLDSLKALAAKQQRTVYRLTLVKAWNVDELQAYAELVSLGNPDFIEVKGVTYCGESSASSLTMANVPWHEEVVHFVRDLVDLIPDYEIACEHEHSNCLLIAHKRFKVGGEWWTWIDYDRFQELVREYEDSGGSATFGARDYTARTPRWAVFGARERGFDPKDTRYQRKNKSKDISGC
ncbi:S-adenosyl-L-methionine-dependent tRNA 4-demethylwyosine synthase TYW1-like isoform X3 [Lutra lutra]|uniref:S-adenosyl-L-methionine-dependent tRNA 4-demethylwyosine synthase TYW1-like isoform X3 n=1 Tax=Lutra lutra TaxID=9657 RepID=UPI001FD30435|nr:S-adenosyl-L-methionine-dependent tRNA 4-demethylwyosine synthase TYW1-like isoform X3 [Lutra lutra]